MPARGLCALTVCILVIAPAFGQQKELPVPTIKRRSELVLIPVVLEPPPFRGRTYGLTAKDFVLLHNGHPEQIAEFEEISANPAHVRQLILPSRTVQNFTSADSHQDVVIVLLDYLNAKTSSDALMRSHFMAMVRELTAMELSFAVLVLSHKGLVLVHSFTSNADILSDAVAQWILEEPTKRANRNENASAAIPDWANVIVPMEAAQTAVALRQSAVLPARAPMAVDGEPTGDMDQAAKTLRAFEQLAEAFRGISGRKKLIWLSSDVPEFGSLAAGRSSVLPLEGASLRASKSMSAANFAVYPVIARRDADTECSIWCITGLEFVSNNYTYKACCPILPLNPIWLPAEMAHTKSENVCDDLPGKCLFRSLRNNLYYLLGFYLHGDSQPGWHNVQVKVNRPDIVHARDGFFVYDGGVPPDLRMIEGNVLARASRNDDAARVALSSPLDYTSIPLRLQWSAASAPGIETQVELVVSSPPGGIAANTDDMSLNIDFLAFFKPVGAKEGHPFPSTLSTVLSPVQQKSFATAGFRFRRQVTLAPGRYEVRVLVRDNVARKMGTVSTIMDLTAPPAPASGEIRP